jgi:transposase InsO family protein
MSCTTTHAARIEMIERHLAGESLATIAQAMQLNVFTVRKFWRRYRQSGWDGLLVPAPAPPRRGPLAHSPTRLKLRLVRLKRSHRGWGVDKLRLELCRAPSLQHVRIPHRSALAAYLARFGARLRQPRRHPTQRPAVPPQAPPSAPHQCWQADIKGDEAVGGCNLRVAPFLVCDSASGAPLGGQVHAIRSRGNRRGLGMREVQADLRVLFTRWGLPDTLRLDRDPLFVGSARLEWPGTLLLWLIGLGVQPIINRAYRPTDNAIVERNHQTWYAHVLDGVAYPSLAAIQSATEQAFADRREQLPSRHVGCAGRPFLVAFPALQTARRAYRAADETQLFDLPRVDGYLAEWRWRRTVDVRGQISLANRNYRVGGKYQGQSISVQFDPASRTFVGRQADGQEVRRWSVPDVDPAYIRGVDH